MLLWGVQPLAIALTVGKIPGGALAFAKIATALAAIACGKLLKGHRPSLPKSRPLLVLATAASLAVSYYLYNACFRYLTPGGTQMYFLTSRLFLALAGIFLFKETFRRVQWLAFAALIAGFGLYFHDQLRVSGEGYALGVLMALGSAATWAAFAVGQKKLLAHYTSAQALLLLYALATLFLAPLADVQPFAHLGVVELAALFVVCATNVAAFFLFSESLRHWDTTKIAAVSTLTPLATVVLVALASLVSPVFHPEPLNFLSAGGAVVAVLAAAAIALLGNRERTI